MEKLFSGVIEPTNKFTVKKLMVKLLLSHSTGIQELWWYSYMHSKSQPWGEVAISI
jgi:hypothetical protein